MHFNSKIMIKNIIDARSFEESQNMMKKQEEEFNKYLKHLKKMQSSRKLDTLTDDKAI